MRIAVIILAMGVIAAGLVKLRRDEVVAQHQSQELYLQLNAQRRTLSEQNARLGDLRAPWAVEARAQDMGVSFNPQGVTPPAPTPSRRSLTASR